YHGTWGLQQDIRMEARVSRAKGTHATPGVVAVALVFMGLVATLGLWALSQPDDGPPRVGLQAGHWRSSALPDELAEFRTATGASAGGVDEVDVNLNVARQTAARLRDRGVVVDVLPATVPPGYEADAFIALHADGALNREARGYKLATPRRASPDSTRLLTAISAEYGWRTRLPRNNAITDAMRDYYAFNSRGLEHAIDAQTPAVIVEMGFVSNARDRAILSDRPDVIAGALADGILRYLDEQARAEEASR
ncbi:MAG: N-acetylmuramoyl-L-alanine amidase, partial [Chloroflexota bacterium]|nr:N-acetylmuramoyl-L-alanine amidase [Chloroflexota bacterium]